MGVGGIWQWVVVLAIVLLLFGTKKLRNLGSDLGQAVKGFRKGVQTDAPAAESRSEAGLDMSAESAKQDTTEPEKNNT